MSISILLGQKAAIKLLFKAPGGAPGVIVTSPPPASGGSVSHGTLNLFSVALDPDQQTVHIDATAVGTDTLTYTGPQGLTATETVTVVLTNATSVSFDETTLVVPDPSPPATYS